jgi:rhodanese-related sulfurtransferase
MHRFMTRILANHPGLAQAAALLLLLPAIGSQALAQGVAEIEPARAASMVEAKQVFVLDVREPSEYNAGHIQDAVLMPLGQVEARLNELAAYKDQQMLVVCATGGRSARAVSILSKNGFTQAQNLKGGMSAWRKANLPLAAP